MFALELKTIMPHTEMTAAGVGKGWVGGRIKR
jgi:hypothetical protein